MEKSEKFTAEITAISEAILSEWRQKDNQWTEYYKSHNYTETYTEITKTTQKHTIYYPDGSISSVTTDTTKPLFKLNPNKGILLFLKAIYNYPLQTRPKLNIILSRRPTNNADTFNNILCYRLAAQNKKWQYTITEIGKKLLAAYNLI